MKTRFETPGRSGSGALSPAETKAVETDIDRLDRRGLPGTGKRGDLIASSGPERTGKAKEAEGPGRGHMAVLPFKSTGTASAMGPES